ncbi:MAG: hypothetical protein A3D52_00520 [Candidatus Taylorbacteria bacterium RIFCSPHIGHO2_02_FULL_44_36]|nr:MAG: hypothetical protein A3D52_00520 [Candidatus Taylorbacteria bacterium RIFCSPHIGHO2_02_FULL_44_36]
MDQKGFANIILIILVVILAGVLGYIILVKKSVSTEQPQLNNLQNTQQTQPSIVKQNPTPTQPTKSKYDDKKVAECVDNYQSEQRRYSSEFGSGYIVVGFPLSTSIVLAKEIIKSHGLAPRETNVGFHSYLYADVTTGQEFLWSCRLKQDTRIRYADPLPSYTLQ